MINPELFPLIAGCELIQLTVDKRIDFLQGTHVHTMSLKCKTPEGRVHGGQTAATQEELLGSSITVQQWMAIAGHELGKAIEASLATTPITTEAANDVPVTGTFTA